MPQNIFRRLCSRQHRFYKNMPLPFGKQQSREVKVVICQDIYLVFSYKNLLYGIIGAGANA